MVLILFFFSLHLWRKLIGAKLEFEVKYSYVKSHKGKAFHRWFKHSCIVSISQLQNQHCSWKFASVCTTISLFPFLFMNKFNWREKENKSQRPCRWKMKLPLMFEPNINSQYEIYVRFIRDSLLKTVFYALTFISQIKNSNIVVMCWLIDRFVDMFSGCGSIILGVYKLIRGHNDEFSCQ